MNSPNELHLHLEEGENDEGVAWVVAEVVDASFSSSHSLSLLLWTADHEPHEGRVSQLELQKGLPQAFLHFLQKQHANALSERQGSPKLA